MHNSKIGIIAGEGRLPDEVIKILKERQQEFVVVFLESLPEVADSLAQKQYQQIAIGQVGKIFAFLKDNQVTQILMVGKVKKPKFSALKVDLTGAKLLAKITKNKLLGDNTILKTVIDFINANNFTVIGTKDLDLPLHLAPDFYGKINNKEAILSDAEIGKSLLLKISDFDVGQSVIIQAGRIIAIEAAEGTDRLIQRSSEFIDQKAKTPALLVKLSKANQDLRVDLPTIGIATIRNLIEHGYGGLVIEAQNTIILNQEEILETITQEKFFIYAY